MVREIREKQFYTPELDLVVEEEGIITSTELGIYASKKNLPPSVENLMAMELYENGLKNISGEVDYSINNSLQH
ncbi:hypothetical protein [Bacillus cereus]|uniref:hypothetical protein n=1 Tax=Bacillus cereus TaxID=1396 RepID=UPI00211D6945|nr:hypothetical protein [Bacillus cereus]